MTTRTISPSQKGLAEYIRRKGPILCVRVSIAQGRGRAKHYAYAYWFAVRYEITLQKDGLPTYEAEDRASSYHRSQRLAESDAKAIAEAEDRLELQYPPGPLSRDACDYIVQNILGINFNISDDAMELAIMSIT